LKKKYPTKIISTRKEEAGLRVWLIAKDKAWAIQWLKWT
jgi:hypothetical protein